MIIETHRFGTKNTPAWVYAFHRQFHDWYDPKPAEAQNWHDFYFRSLDSSWPPSGGVGSYWDLMQDVFLKTTAPDIDVSVSYVAGWSRRMVEYRIYVFAFSDKYHKSAFILRFTGKESERRKCLEVD